MRQEMSSILIFWSFCVQISVHCHARRRPISTQCYFGRRKYKRSHRCSSFSGMQLIATISQQSANKATRVGSRRHVLLLFQISFRPVHRKHLTTTSFTSISVEKDWRQQQKGARLPRKVKREQPPCVTVSLHCTPLLWLQLADQVDGWEGPAQQPTGRDGVPRRS